MKRAETTKKQLIKVIDSLQKQIKKLAKLGFRLKHKEEELMEFDRALEDQVESRTSAERIIHRQLDNEIEQRKQSERVIQDALEYANGIINTVRESLIILDTDLKVISASRSFYQTFKVKLEATEKQYISGAARIAGGYPSQNHKL
jgi:two-component system CheB/CheR fusion protein